VSIQAAGARSKVSKQLHALGYWFVRRHGGTAPWRPSGPYPQGKSRFFEDLASLNNGGPDWSPQFADNTRRSVSVKPNKTM